MSACGGGLNGSTQHFILNGKMECMQMKGIVRGKLLELSGVLILASVDEKPIPIFQDVAGDDPPGGDDVCPFSAFVATGRGSAP